jgi:hypothetical protein
MTTNTLEAIQPTNHQPHVSLHNRLHTVSCGATNVAEKPVKCSVVRIGLYAFLALSERKAAKIRHQV